MRDMRGDSALSIEWKFKNIDSVFVLPTDIWIDLGQVTSLCNTTDSFLVKMNNEISFPLHRKPSWGMLCPHQIMMSLSLIFTWCLLVGVLMTRSSSEFTANRTPFFNTHSLSTFPVTDYLSRGVAAQSYQASIPPEPHCRLELSALVPSHTVCRALSECSNFRSWDPQGDLQNCHFCLYAAGP